MSETTTQMTRRLSSVLLLIGAALLLVGNTAHPIDPAPSATSRLALAAGGSWIMIHLIVAVGVLAVVGALVVLPWAIAHPVGAAYARLGAAAAIIGGGALAIVFGALDGYGQHALAASWQTAGGAEREALETVALALEVIDSGMSAIGILALFGCAMALLGAAVLTSRIVARWIGWAAVVIGLFGTVTGLLFAAQGPTPLVINMLFRPVAMAATVFFVALAVALRRAAPVAATIREDAGADALPV
jgi:hypothetical protein